MENIKSVHMGHRSHLKSVHIVLLGNKILLFKVLKMQNKALSVIIVPEQLRRFLFTTVVVLVEDI